MSKPAVSVLMPAYNAQRFLPASVRSILDQTFRDFEFIIVDDGSKDSTKSMLDSYAAQDNRIRVISRPNTGIVGALNDGLAVAQADWIARMDSDDIALPERLAVQMAFLRANPDCVAVGSSVELIDPWGGAVCHKACVADHAHIEAILLRGNSDGMVHPAAMISRQALADIGGYRREYDTVEDLDLFLRLGERGRLANLPERLLLYRQHMSSTNHTRFEKQRRLTRLVVEEAHQRRGLPAPTAGVVEIAEQKSVGEFHRNLSLLALNAGNYATARRNAWAALKLEPCSRRSWWCVGRAMAGRGVGVYRRARVTVSGHR